MERRHDEHGRPSGGEWMYIFIPHTKPAETKSSLCCLMRSGYLRLLPPNRYRFPRWCSTWPTWLSRCYLSGRWCRESPKWTAWFRPHLGLASASRYGSCWGRLWDNPAVNGGCSSAGGALFIIRMLCRSQAGFVCSVVAGIVGWLRPLCIRREYAAESAVVSRRRRHLSTCLWKHRVVLL